MSYPLLDDPDFQQKIANKKEFQIQKINQTIEDLCTPQRFKLFEHQLFVRNFISPDTPYNNLLMFFATGTSKTCSAIQIAEEHKNQKRKIIVLLEEGIRNNFINEIHDINKDENQCTGSTYQKYRATHTKEEKEIIKQKQIKQYYKFKTLGKFTNEILKLMKTNQGKNKIKEDYSNRLIIIDEVHNFREYDTDQLKRYDALKNMISIAENCKLLLLSATPMFDNPREIVSLMNLFLLNENKSTVEADKMFDKNDNLTIMGEKLLRTHMNGQVAYVGKNPLIFPQIRFRGKLFPFMKNLKLVNCPMSTFQRDEYLKNINEHITVLRKNSNCIPPKSKEELQNPQKISSKFHRLLNEISKSSGLVFIYSEFVEHTIKLLKQMFVLNGYREYVNEQSKNSFIVLEGDTDSKKRTSLINLFNNPANMNGKYIKIIIGSKVLKEGISLKNVQQVHIMEPWYNVSRLKQVWGRAVRACSHVLLPDDKQKVDIFLYAATFDIPENSIELVQKEFSEIKTKIPYDLYAYYLSEQKNLKIERITKILKEISVNTGRAKEQDTSTYDSYFVNTPLVNLTKNIILDIIKQKKYVSIDQLPKNKEIKQNNITSDVIQRAVYELRNEILQNGRIIRRDEFLIFQPPNKPENISMFDRKNTFEKNRIPLKTITYPSQENEPPQSSDNKKRKLQTSTEILKNDKIIENYQGILMSDGKFLIKQVVDTTNKRKQTRGKNCMSWNSDELFNLAQIVLSPEEIKQFFVDKKIKNKTNFCRVLLKKFYP